MKAPDQSGVARYAQLASALRHRIASGQWPPGTRLPTVGQLAKESGLAAITVRQAYGLLAAEGLITSRRGLGTHVQAMPSGLGQGLVSAINDMAVGMADLQIELLEKTTHKSLPADLTRVGTAAPDYTRVLKLHLHDGVPFSLMELYVDTQVYRQFPRGADKRMKIGHLLHQALGERIGLLYQVVTLEPADALLAERLQYSFAAPVVRVIRITRDSDDRILTAGHYWYRGDRFVLEMDVPAQLMQSYPAVTVPISRQAAPAPHGTRK